MCSLCGSDLYQTSYSNHYCRTNIPIKSNDLIKGFLRKDSLIRKEREDKKITAIYKLNQLKAKYLE